MFNQAGKLWIHVYDTSQEISLTICLYLPKTFPGFHFYRRSKIPSLKKLWWSRDMSVYKGKEIEKATRNPRYLLRGCVWAPHLHRQVQQERTAANAKGRCLRDTPMSRVTTWQPSHTMLRFSRAEWLKPSRCAMRGMGTHKRPVRPMAAPAAPPARWCVRTRAGRLLPRDDHRWAWQIRWDLATKFPAKRPNSQVSVFFPSRSSDGMTLT